MALVFMLVAAPPAASAASCGDAVLGQRVACACGDVVVADTVLRATDPVVTARCAGDGLVLRAAAGARAIRLDLAGESITGFGGGVGLRVLDGGMGGAVIDGGDGGAVIGFRNGLRATRPGSVAEVRDLAIRGSSSDGLVVRGNGTRLLRVRADDSGRDGLRVGGSSVQLDDVAAERNGRYGLRTTGNATGNARVGENASGVRLGGTATAVTLEPAQ
ncbi:MAG: hypothetical protein V3R77_06860 [Candidatus Binatia bacterium]